MGMDGIIIIYCWNDVSAKRRELR